MAHSVRRLAVLAIVAAALTAVPTHGASHRTSGSKLTDAANQVISRLWSVLASPWRRKAGGVIDPNGQCGTTPSPSCGQEPAGEAGGVADPNGGEAGGVMDPNG
jgi:hypothetical protein